MDQHAKLDDLLDRWEDQLRRGLPADPAALCANDPELLPELRRQIDMLRRIDALIDTQLAGDQAAKPAAGGASGRLPADDRGLAVNAGRYVPMRFHAEGGLGFIVVARDSELQRDVALKLMKREWLASPESRQRFALEAEITGRLEHPGIVPVYGFGREGGDQPSGQPFYAMRFIRGESLQAAIDRFQAADAVPREPGERSLEFQRLLRNFLAVCETMAYAHSRGIIHRDLKPANVMLGKYGETLVVDWGLAKIVGRDEPAETAAEQSVVLTPSTPVGESVIGQAKGSPAYMSPEQVDGRWDVVGPASDIYSLGAMLYTLLTGQRAFDGETLNQVFDKVRRGDFAAPRTVNPQAPRALEAICLKAMERLPERRYATARDLADDIEHWLADEPVSALPEPWTTRAYRWLRRHRTLVTASAIGLFVTLLGLVATTLILRAKNAELTVARARTEQSFELAHGAVRDLLDQATGNPLLHKPGMHKAQESLLRTALKYYRDFLAFRSDDPQLQQECAQAHLLVGQIVEEIGSPHEALAEYEAAQSILQALAGTAPVPELDRSLGQVATRLARLNGQLGQMQASREFFQRALARYNALVARYPDSPRFKLDLASVQLALGEANDDVSALNLARATFEQVGTTAPLPADMRAALARTYTALALHHSLLGQMTDAEVALAQAEETLHALEGVEDRQAVVAQIRGQLEMVRGAVQQKRGSQQDAIAAYEAARRQFDELSAENPDVSDFRLRAAEANLSLGKLYRVAEQPELAEQHLRQARTGFERLAANNPRLLDRYQLARSIIDLGGLLAGTDEADAAAPLLAQSQSILKGLVAVDAGNPSYQRDLAATYSGQARLAMDDEDFPRAVDSLERARLLLEPVVAQHPERLEFTQALGRVEQNLGIAQMVVGDWPVALARFEAADQRIRRLASDHSDVKQYALDREQFARLLLSALSDGLQADLLRAEHQRDARVARQLLNEQLQFLKRLPNLDARTQAAITAAEKLLKEDR